MDEFYISFDTKANTGKLEAVKVALGLETVVDLNKALPIALRDHPLYRDLQAYVLANPV